MPLFKYRGYNQEGLELEGSIEADGQRDAALKLRESGVFPKEITEAAFQPKRIFFRRQSPFILSGITRQLSILLSSGTPLTEALGAIASEHKGMWRSVLIDIKEQVSAGAPLARAMQTYPDIFPVFYTGMVSAGESSGELTGVLLKLADFLDTEAITRSKVQTALIYPIFMACISFLIVTFLFTFVVPKITKIFEDTSATLPFITVVLIWISTAFQKFWWLLLFLLAGFVLLYRRIKKTKKGIIDSILLKDPSGIMMSLYMNRFSMTMSFLLSGGLPILRAMQLTAGAIGNTVLENRIMAAMELVSQGAKLSASLDGFPQTLLQIIHTGEQTGKLPEVLKKVSRSYEVDFDRKLQRMIGILEPSLILLMGLIVGFIVIAVLLPIFELNQLIR